MISKWNISGNGTRLSQKVLDKVKPETPIKNKIDGAQNKLQLQITKLESITEKLKKKHDHVFNKIVEAQKLNNHTYARAYATELHEIRKMNNMVSGAKLAMEQIRIRLNTVSELGDVIVTLSPCMSMIKGLGTSISAIMPEASSSIQDLSKILGDVMSNSSVSHDGLMPARDEQSADTLAILEEAHAVIEGQAKAKIPEVPSTLPEGQAELRKTLT